MDATQMIQECALRQEIVKAEVEYPSPYETVWDLLPGTYVQSNVDPFDDIAPRPVFSIKITGTL